MKKEFCLCVLIFSIVAVASNSIGGQNNNNDEKFIMNQSLSQINNPTTQQNTIEALQTAENPTTKAPEKPTTEAPETTSKAPETTSKAPETTTKIPDTTTTEPPKTTTKAPETTTKIPDTTTTEAPIPKPPLGRWNTKCVMLQMATQIEFPYVPVNLKNVTYIINVPKEATAEAECDSPDSKQLVLKWNTTKEENTFTFQFAKNNTNYYIVAIVITIQIDDKQFMDIQESQTVHFVAKPSMKTPINMSYHCTRKEAFNLTSNPFDVEKIGELRTYDFQYEAFFAGNHTVFSPAKDCDAADTPDIVPIAIGIALIILILIVLIAYLFARQRSNARGYTSF